jgi:hypothetical protein
MKKLYLLALTVVLPVLQPGAASADDAGLRQCRGIADSAKRLACYDALALPAVDAPPPARADAAAKPAPPQQEAKPETKSTGSSLLSLFGLEHKAPKEQLDSIESTIPGHFEGWGPRSKITLANGQVWQVIEDHELYMNRDNPKVTIRRGALGVFYMDIEGDNRSPKVTRIR